MVALHKPPTTKDIPPDGFKHIEGCHGETRNEENAEQYEGIPKHAPDVDPKESMQRLSSQFGCQRKSYDEYSIHWFVSPHSIISDTPCPS